MRSIISLYLFPLPFHRPIQFTYLHTTPFAFVGGGGVTNTRLSLHSLFKAQHPPTDPIHHKGQAARPQSPTEIRYVHQHSFIWSAANPIPLYVCSNDGYFSLACPPAPV